MKAWHWCMLAGMALVYFNHRFWTAVKRRDEQGCGCDECRARKGGL